MGVSGFWAGLGRQPGCWHRQCSAHCSGERCGRSAI